MHNLYKSLVFLLSFIFTFSFINSQELKVDLTKSIGNQHISNKFPANEIPNLMLVLTGFNPADNESNYKFSGENFAQTSAIIELTKTVQLIGSVNAITFNLNSLDISQIDNEDDKTNKIFKYKIEYSGSNKPAIFGSATSFSLILKISDPIPPKKKQTQYVDPTQIPIPIFKYSDDNNLSNSKKNRYLIIDASTEIKLKKNNTLYRIKEKDGVEDLVKSNSIPVHSSVAILIKNYNFNGIEAVTVNINGVDFSYNQDLGTLYAKIDTSDEVDLNAFDAGQPNQLNKYLDTVLDIFKSNKFLNINDIYLLENYKIALEKAVNNQGNTLSIEEITLLSEILLWKPEFVSLTPISLTAPDADEVEIKVIVRKKGEPMPREYIVGTYLTSGGLGIAINNNIYFTGLKNNQSYTETVKTSDTTTEKYAYLDTANQLSIGIGLNSEVSFRTGSIFRPTLNVGFFIPFEEEISPYLALGPGISMGTKKVKLNVQGGIAFGKVNAIQQQYIGKDLNLFDDLSGGVTEKIWKSSWYFGVGVSYNLKQN